MGCGASAGLPPDVQRTSADWTILSVRIRWSGFENKSPDLTLTVSNLQGETQLFLRGGTNTPTFGSINAKKAIFSSSGASGSAAFVTEERLPPTKKAPKTRYIATQQGSEVCLCDARAWKCIDAACSELFPGTALPKVLRVSHKANAIFVSKDGYLPDVDSDRAFAIQQPDDTTDLASREPTAMDDLIAILSTRGKRPRNDDGSSDYSGDMAYELKVRPKLLAAVDDNAGARCLLLAMCTDPFWARADQCVGYNPTPAGRGGLR